jgi:hypothetical protein
MDTSTDDSRLKKASQHLLQRDMGIIPSILLRWKIDIKVVNRGGTLSLLYWVKWKHTALLYW